MSGSTALAGLAIFLSTLRWTAGWSPAPEPLSVERAGRCAGCLGGGIQHARLVPDELRHGAAMKGVPLLKVQLREVWLSRSFTNWTGKAWGGGRWSGSVELHSDPIME